MYAQAVKLHSCCGGVLRCPAALKGCGRYAKIGRYTKSTVPDATAVSDHRYGGAANAVLLDTFDLTSCCNMMAEQ